MKEFKRLFPFFKKYRGILIISWFALIVVDLIQIVFPQFLRIIIDNITGKNPSLKVIITYSSIILIASALIYMLRYVWRILMAGVTSRLIKFIRSRIFSHLVYQPVSFFYTNKIGDMMAHITNDVDAVRMAFMPGLVVLTDILLMGTLVIIFMLSLSWRLTLLIMIPMPFLFIFVRLIGGQIHRKFKRVQESFSNLTAFVAESISGIRVIKAYARERERTDMYESRSRDYLKRSMELIKIWGLFGPGMVLFSNISSILLLYLGGIKVIGEELSIGEFVAFQFYIGLFMWPVIGTGWLIDLLQRGSASMNRINRILSIEGEKREGIDIIPSGDIKIKDLTFRYHERTVLNKINLRIKEKEKIGVCGKIGSGKSTLLNIIPRIIEPPDGTVFMGNLDVKKIKMENLREVISFVPQDSFLFSTTIRENIKFGNPEISDEKMREIAEACEILKEIETFPEGFDTQVGERGITLSGGQKQRIAIARALLMDRPYLILDDALSSVDADTEERIINNILPYLKDKTVIISSQRFKIFSHLDRILVMDKGEIVEEGTHESLIKKEGIYYLLWSLQQK